MPPAPHETRALAPEAFRGWAETMDNARSRNERDALSRRYNLPDARQEIVPDSIELLRCLSDLLVNFRRNPNPCLFPRGRNILVARRIDRSPESVRRRDVLIYELLLALLKVQGVLQEKRVCFFESLS